MSDGLPSAPRPGTGPPDRRPDLGAGDVLADDRVRDAVRHLVDRLGGSISMLVTPGWERVATGAGLAADVYPARRLPGGDDLSAPAVIYVGPPDQVVAAAGSAEFGILTVSARLGSRWRPTARSYLDPTMLLWRAGWSPVAIDRMVVDGPVGRVEMVVGNVRPTPASALALDDGD